MLHSDRVRQTAAGGEKGHAGESKNEEEQNRNNTEVQSEISLFFPRPDGFCSYPVNIHSQRISLLRGQIQRSKLKSLFLT